MYQPKYEELDPEQRVSEALGQWLAEKAEKWLAEQGIKVLRFDVEFVEHNSDILDYGDMDFIMPTLYAGLAEAAPTVRIFAGGIDAQITAAYVATMSEPRQITRGEHDMIVLLGTGNLYYSDAWKKLVSDAELEQYKGVLWTTIMDEADIRPITREHI